MDSGKQRLTNHLHLLLFKVTVTVTVRHRCKKLGYKTPVAAYVPSQGERIFQLLS
jgi:hypothetical protein